MWVILADGYLPWTSKHHTLTFQHDGHVGGYIPQNIGVVIEGQRTCREGEVVVIAELRGGVDEAAKAGPFHWQYHVAALNVAKSQLPANVL